MAQSPRDLTDIQWAILDPLIPEPTRRKDGRGRPWKDRRCVLNGILYILRTGVPWADLPERYPPYQPVTVVFNSGCALLPTMREFAEQKKSHRLFTSAVTGNTLFR